MHRERQDHTGVVTLTEPKPTYDVPGNNQMPSWISDTIGSLMAWMREAGVTEIVITTEGATWR